MITLLLLYSYRPVCFPPYPHIIVLYRFQGIQYKVWCVSKHDYRCIAAAVESPSPLLTCLHTKMNTLEFIAKYCCTAVVTWIKISRLYLYSGKTGKLYIQHCKGRFRTILPLYNCFRFCRTVIVVFV